MQKYIKNDLSDIRYFENEVKVCDWIDLKEYRLMTETEIIKHETPKPTEFHTIWVWDNEPSAGHWEDGYTEEEKLRLARKRMSTLTPIEFDIKLVDAGLYDQVQELIQSDIKLKIAYTRATFFSRTDPFINQARIALNLTDEQVDAMWMNQP